MKKDIEIPKVEDIAFAVVLEENELAEAQRNVYVINLKNESIEGVLVSSKGYGKVDDKEVKTSTLRHFLDVVDGQSFAKVEQIIDDVVGLNNEYHLSFYLGGKMYDKKFVFLPESLIEDNFTDIPLLNKRGVLIK